MTTQRQYNELTARLSRLETLLQNNDAYAPPGAVTLAEMDLGPGLDFGVPTYDQFLNAPTPDVQWDPEYSQTVLNDQLEANDGFAATDAAVTEMQYRLQAIETYLTAGSNDTDQSDALNANQATGQDGFSGTETLTPTTHATEFCAMTGGTTAAYGVLTTISYTSSVDPYTMAGGLSIIRFPRSGFVQYEWSVSALVTFGAASSVFMRLVNVTGVTATNTDSTFLASASATLSASHGVIIGARYVQANDELYTQLTFAGVSIGFGATLVVRYVDPQPPS